MTTFTNTPAKKEIQTCAALSDPDLNITYHISFLKSNHKKIKIFLNWGRDYTMPKISLSNVSGNFLLLILHSVHGSKRLHHFGYFNLPGTDLLTAPAADTACRPLFLRPWVQ